jgi:hypothetical protein
VKSGFQKANNLAFCRWNALSSAKGTGIREANNLASLRLSNPELCEGGVSKSQQFDFTPIERPELREGDGI